MLTELYPSAENEWGELQTPRVAGGRQLRAGGRTEGAPGRFVPKLHGETHPTPCSSRLLKAHGPEVASCR